MTIQLKNGTVSWLSELSYWAGFGACTAHDRPTLQTSRYRRGSFPFTLREEIQRANPDVPTADRENALQRMQDLGLVTLLSSKGAEGYALNMQKLRGTGV